MAGARTGLEHGESRLFADHIRIMDGLAERGLKWAVWENVPGVLSIKDDNDEWTFEHVVAALVGADRPVRLSRRARWNAGLADRGGRAAAWRVVDSRHFGVPQRRRRVYAVVAFGGAAADRAGRALLAVPEGVSGDTAACSQTGQGAARAAAGGVDGGGEPFTFDVAQITSKLNRLQVGPGRPASTLAQGSDMAVVSPAVTAKWAKGTGGPSGDECQNLIPQVAHTLTGEGFDASEDGTGRGTPLVPQSFNWQQGDAEYSLADDAHTLGTSSAPAVLMTMREGKDGGGKGPLLSEDESLTLATGNGQVLFAPTLTAANDPSRSPQSTEVTQQVAAVHAAGYGVRRLTPTEATRLQGFPDQWLEVCHADAEEAYAREVVQRLWSEARAEASSQRRSRGALSLLSPEVLLAGVHGGWLSWEVARRCAAGAREVQGEDAWPEEFMRGLWSVEETGSASRRRGPAEQLARQLGRPVPFMPHEEAPAASVLRGTRLWEEAPSQWVLRHARPEGEEVGRPVPGEARRPTCSCGGPLSDSARYKALGNAVTVNVPEWLFARMLKVAP